MRAVIQRVREASVVSGDRLLGSIGPGFVVLLGVAAGDSEEDARLMADRIIGLRVFADEANKMNLDIKQAGGELLVISQFTLLADTDSGRRPSFIKAAPPALANQLYERFISICREAGVIVATGEFGANMNVSLVNQGPVTITLDSRRS